jgi:hypothetical protein
MLPSIVFLIIVIVLTVVFWILTFSYIESGWGILWGVGALVGTWFTIGAGWAVKDKLMAPSTPTTT